MIIVSDTSAISNLYQIGLLQILKDLYGEISISPAVKSELSFIPEQAQLLAQLDWIILRQTSNTDLVQNLLEDLDLGEAESIALALEYDAKYLIIDEYRGRSIAENLGIKVVGILGILIQAKQEGLITSVKEPIEQLKENGFRLNQNLINTVLERLGEQ